MWNVEMCRRCCWAIAETVHHGIKNSEWVIFENSAHMAHVEEAEKYVRVLEAFLKKVETASRNSPARPTC
jgi:hypothetical protein